jgi:hypothetical protein
MAKQMPQELAGEAPMGDMPPELQGEGEMPPEAAGGETFVVRAPDVPASMKDAAPGDQFMVEIAGAAQDGALQFKIVQ